MRDNNANAAHFADELQTDLDRGLVLEWAEVYALDALSEQERATLEAFVSAASPQIRQRFDDRVRTAREVLASAYGAEEAEPPADLFVRITAQLPPAAPAARETGGSTGPSASAEGYSPSAESSAVEEPAPSEVTDLDAKRKQRRAGRGSAGARRWLIAAAAAAVLAIGGTAVGINLATQQDPQQQVLQASDVKTATIDIPGGGTATISVSHSKDAAVVAMKNVPAPQTGTVYQMWLIPSNGSDPSSAGIMDAAALSKPATVKGINAATAVAITVEPAPGSARPTTKPIKVVPLNS